MFRYRESSAAVFLLAALMPVGSAPAPRVAAAALQPAVSLDALARRSLARLDGELRLEGLKEPVEVLRDEFDPA